MIATLPSLGAGTVHSNYLDAYSHPRALNYMTGVCKTLLGSIKFDTILYTGISGSLIATPLGIRMHKYACAVRKDDSHSLKPLEGILGQRVLIVDDFVSSGDSLRNMLKIVRGKKYAREVAGCLLYNCWTQKENSAEKYAKRFKCDFYLSEIKHIKKAYSLAGFTF